MTSKRDFYKKKCSVQLFFDANGINVVKKMEQNGPSG